MKFAPPLTPEDNALDVNLTPLIDVVFLLLIFFLVTTTFADQRQIPIELPGATTGDSRDTPPLVTVTVTAQSTYVVDERTLSESELRALLRGNYRDAKELVVRADKTAPHGAVTTVLDAAREAGIQKFGIAVERN